MLYRLAGFLVLVWLLVFGVFHVGGGSIHMLLLIATYSTIWHVPRVSRASV